jgi:carboxymethylenebutenolidase
MMSLRPLLSSAVLLAGVALGADPPHAHGSDANSPVPSHQGHPVDSRAPTPKGKSVELTLSDGKTSTAYVAHPKGTPRGGLLLVHEYWGLNDWVKAEADRYAGQGYLVLAVDLYDGHVATQPDEAEKLMKSLTDAHATAVETAGVDWLVKNVKGKKIATLGWCAGGGEALNASLTNPDKVLATVIFYGLPVNDVARLRKLRGPILGIWAKKDGWITPTRVAAFDTALKDAGIKHEFRSYDADHAFANPTGGRYNPPAAQDANDAARRFLAAQLK